LAKVHLLFTYIWFWCCDSVTLSVEQQEGHPIYVKILKLLHFRRTQFNLEWLLSIGLSAYQSFLSIW